ncbi:MAG: hypothetical protein PVS3B3_18910 [Ktedonobacteraceae bacterium]
MFDLEPNLNAITDGLPDLGATCRRCKTANVEVWPVSITYPGTWRHLDCCQACKDEIRTAFDKVAKELGLYTQEADQCS